MNPKQCKNMAKGYYVLECPTARVRVGKFPEIITQYDIDKILSRRRREQAEKKRLSEFLRDPSDEWDN